MAKETEFWKVDLNRGSPKRRPLDFVIPYEEVAETKWCTVCDAPYPLDQFNLNKAQPDGLNHMCRKCDNQYGKEKKRKRRESMP